MWAMLAYSAIFKEEHETYGIRNDHDFLCYRL